ADELVSDLDVQRWVSDQTPAPHFDMMPGVSHFFHGHLTRLRRGVSDFVNTQLELPGKPA
ncbi:MAG: hypothetical protein HKN70_04015, partial [Gammaproteobacteria bacterium]|nr:hypothetical protein [Gammaproteobacteria bacterium]